MNISSISNCSFKGNIVFDVDKERRVEITGLIPGDKQGYLPVEYLSENDKAAIRSVLHPAGWGNNSIMPSRIDAKQIARISKHGMTFKIPSGNVATVAFQEELSEPEYHTFLTAINLAANSNIDVCV